MNHSGSIIIKHKGKDIYYVDYTNLKTPEEFKEKTKGTAGRIKFYEENNVSNLLALTDVTGSYLTGDSSKYMKASAKLVKPFLEKSAVVGVTGAKKVLLNIINLFSGYQTKAFDTIDEAKDWLVS